MATANRFAILGDDGKQTVATTTAQPTETKPPKAKTPVGLGLVSLYMCFLFLTWNATPDQVKRLAKSFGISQGASQEASQEPRRQKANPQRVSKRQRELTLENLKRQEENAYQAMCASLSGKIGELFAKAFSVARGIVPDVSQILLTDANGTTFVIVESREDGHISMFQNSDRMFWNKTSKGFALVHVSIGKDGEMTGRTITWSYICDKNILTYEVGNSVIDFSVKKGASSDSVNLRDWNVYLHPVQQEKVEKIPASETPVSDDEDPTN